MSFIDNLLSLPSGLVTATIGSFIGIKVLKVKIDNSRDTNVSINGDGNRVSINESNKDFNESYHYIWNTLLVLVVVLYPLFGRAFNQALAALTVMAIPVAGLGLVRNIRQRGFKGIITAWYLVGAVVVTWVSYCASNYLDYTASRAGQFWADVSVLGSYLKGFSPAYLLSFLSGLGPYLITVTQNLFAIFGFAGLLCSALYVAFAWVTRRSYDGAVRFSVSLSLCAIFSYFMACHAATAAQNGRFDYVAGLLGRLIDPLLAMS